MDTLLIELHHQPLTSYFGLIKQYPKLLIEGHETFQKQTLRNRTYILTSQKVQLLSVPVLHSSTSIRDVRIDYSQRWINDHLRSITSAYKHAPYFEYCFPYYEEIYLRNKLYLFDLNLDLLLLSLKILRWNKEIKVTEQYVKEYPVNSTNDSRLKFNNLVHGAEVPSFVKYSQVFNNEFISNLSILDYIFCCGF